MGKWRATQNSQGYKEMRLPNRNLAVTNDSQNGPGLDPVPICMGRVFNFEYAIKATLHSDRINGDRSKASSCYTPPGL